MTGSELPAKLDLRRDIECAINRLAATAAADSAALVADADRALVDRSVAGALALSTDDPAVQSLLGRFSPGTQRRPARAGDVLITLRLLQHALPD